MLTGCVTDNFQWQMVPDLIHVASSQKCAACCAGVVWCRYNQFRRLLQLPPLDSIDEISSDPAVRANLKSVYNNDIEMVDLLPGTLAETRRPAW